MAALRRLLVLLLALTLVTVPQALAGQVGQTTADADSGPIQWSPGPVVLANDEITFTTPLDADDIQWNWPDGTSDKGKTVTHRFSDPGTPTVELVLQDPDQVRRSKAEVTVQGFYTRDQIVTKQVFIKTSGEMDLEAEYDDEEYASTDAAPEGTPLAHDDIYIDATIYYPDPDVADGPWPAMMTTHGWGGHKSQYEGYGSSFAEEGAGAYAQEGYVGLVYNTRGTANSTGYQRAYDPQQEMQDARDILSWLADNEAHDGDVYDNRGFRPDTTLNFTVELDEDGDPSAGMFGQSNGGITTTLLAGQDDRLDAAAPGGVYHNLTFSMLPNGVPKSVLIAGIAAGAGLNFGARQLVERGNVDVFLNNPGLWGTVDTEIPSWMVQGFTGVEGDLREDFRDRAPIKYNDAIGIPTFLSHGWMDQFFEPPNPLHNYEQIASNPHFSSLSDDARDRQVKLVMQPTGHDFYEHMVQDMRVPWFNHFLKGHSLDATYHGVVDRYNGDNPGDIVTKEAVNYSYVVEQPPVLFHEDHPEDERCVSMGQPQGCGHPGTQYAWYDRASLDRWTDSGPDHWYDPYTGFHYRAYDDPIWTHESPDQLFLRSENRLSQAPPSTGIFQDPTSADVIANVPGPGWTTWNPAGAQDGTPWRQVDHAPGATIRYTSSALEEDVTAIGHAEANLDVILSANGPLDSGGGDVHFVVKVWDLSPTGEIDLATRGYKAVGLEDRADKDLSDQGIAREVEVPLYSMDRVFPEGHRIVVEITHSDASYVMPSLVPHTTLIQHSPLNPSWVELPIRSDAELDAFSSPITG